jgi:hypothetical protein
LALKAAMLARSSRCVDIQEERLRIQLRERQKNVLEDFKSSRCCEVLLVRHGESEWNEDGRLQGQILPGPPLTLRGRRQVTLPLNLN